MNTGNHLVFAVWFGEPLHGQPEKSFFVVKRIHAPILIAENVHTSGQLQETHIARCEQYPSRPRLQCALECVLSREPSSRPRHQRSRKPMQFLMAEMYLLAATTNSPKAALLLDFPPFVKSSAFYSPYREVLYMQPDGKVLFTTMGEFSSGDSAA